VCWVIKKDSARESLCYCVFGCEEEQRAGVLVLQCVAVCCSVTVFGCKGTSRDSPRVAVCFSMLQCISACWPVEK